MTDRSSSVPASGRDLVARLRWPEGISGPEDHPVSVKLRVEAADEIEKLRRNLRHWREECGKLHARMSQSSPSGSPVGWGGDHLNIRTQEWLDANRRIADAERPTHWVEGPMHGPGD